MGTLLTIFTLNFWLIFLSKIKFRCLIVMFFLNPLISSCKTATIPPEIQAASYVLRGIQFYFAYMTPDEITVQSKGSGKDENEAIDKAIIAAVQQAMGVLVVSEITTSDEKVLSELAGMYSSGIVKSYEKKNCTNTSVVECTIEAKVKAKDSTETELRKINIIKSLNITTAYNLAEDEFNLSPIRVSSSFDIARGFAINAGATFDAYALDENNNRINTFNVKNGGGLLRLTSANISTQWVGWSLSVAACVMWVWFGYKDKDWPRMIMECMYMILSIRAVFNWLGL